MSTAVQTLPCPLWRRLLALLYDLLAVLAIVMVVAYVCQRLTGGQLIHTGDHVQIAWWYQPLQGLIISAYFIVSWLRGGQTLGMRPWRLRLTCINGGSVRLTQAILRVLVAAVPVTLLELAPWLGPAGALGAVGIAWGLWFTVALSDPRRRALHDLVAGTQLQRIG